MLEPHHWRFAPTLPCCSSNPEPGRLGRCAFQASRGLCTEPGIRGPCPVACEQCTLCAGHPLLAMYDKVYEKRRGRGPGRRCAPHSIGLHTLFVGHAFEPSTAAAAAAAVSAAAGAAAAAAAATTATTSDTTRHNNSHRAKEFCAALAHNAAHPCVERLTVLSMLPNVADLCNLTSHQRQRVRVSELSSERQLTYAALLASASAAILESTGKGVSGHGALAGDAPGTAGMQVVLHADIMLGDWPMIPRDCLGRMRELRMAFALSRHQPTRCVVPLPQRQVTPSPSTAAVTESMSIPPINEASAPSLTTQRGMAQPQGDICTSSAVLRLPQRWDPRLRALLRSGGGEEEAEGAGRGGRGFGDAGGTSTRASPSTKQDDSNAARRRMIKSAYQNLGMRLPQQQQQRQPLPFVAGSKSIFHPAEMSQDALVGRHTKPPLTHATTPHLPTQN